MNFERVQEAGVGSGGLASLSIVTSGGSRLRLGGSQNQ